MQYRLIPDLQSALTDKFTDSAIAMNSKVNGEHKEKVLQRWEGGDSNSDDYDLESDMVQSPFWRTLELGGSAAEVCGLLTVTSFLEPRVAGVGRGEVFYYCLLMAVRFQWKGIEHTQTEITCFSTISN